MQNWLNWAKRIGVVMVALIVAACSSMQASDQAKIDAALKQKAKDLQQYRIGPSDVVMVSVWRNPDLSMSVPVRPDGKISTPLIGDIQAAGLAPEELAANIKNKLTTFIREPQVSVVVTSMNSHEFLNRVRVTGAVNAPATMAYQAGMTVLDAVLSAGGLNEFADGNNTMLYRKLGGETVAIPVHLKDILSKGDIDSNYEMQPGDIITVPEKLL